jgi:dTDP-glucose pyrophosphorylase
MAGLNTRFHDVGFDIPKYLLPWGEHTIIAEIISQFQKSYKFEQILLLANKRDTYFKKKLLDSISPLGLDETSVYYIGDTTGQAHTASIGAQLAKNPRVPLVVHNADTIVTGRDFTKILADLQSNEAHIDVFIANNPKYCYLRTQDNKVIEIVEKQAISPYASSGLYSFKNSTVYLDNYHSAANDFGGKELYVSNVLAHMLADGLRLVTNALDNYSETIVLGSPQEYGLELAKKSLNENDNQT